MRRPLDGPGNNLVCDPLAGAPVLGPSRAEAEQSQSKPRGSEASICVRYLIWTVSKWHLQQCLKRVAERYLSWRHTCVCATVRVV